MNQKIWVYTVLGVLLLLFSSSCLCAPISQLLWECKIRILEMQGFFRSPDLVFGVQGDELLSRPRQETYQTHFECTQQMQTRTGSYILLWYRHLFQFINSLQVILIVLCCHYLFTGLISPWRPLRTGMYICHHLEYPTHIRS